MIRILLADDHAMVRAGLRHLLEQQPDMCVIAEAQDGAEAISLACQLTPTVAILDIGLPGIDGLEALERIKARVPQVRVLMLTGWEKEHYLQRALCGGASGYLLKQSRTGELLRAVRTVARGELAFAGLGPDDVVELCDHRTPPHHSMLTEREREVLRMVACGYSNVEIAARLAISPKTVDAHRTRLMSKLDLHKRADLTAYALHQGFLVVA